MFIDIDYDKRKKGYKINLAKPNKQTIASISEAYGANYSIKLGNINEVTFNVPYFIDKLDERVKNENIELIREKMYTRISYNNNDEWMIIDTIEDVGSGDEKYMTVTAFTNVYETSNRKINELNLEVVNPEEYYNAVLNDVAWSIGTIDPLFKDIYRSVELSNVTVLEAIITGAETFGAVLDFDTENKKINLIDMDSRAKYRGLNINYSNFLQSINRKRSVDEMTTRLYVYGSEDLSIENVNPTGMRYLEDFTYFLYPFERDENKNVIKSSHYMSDELAHAILDKNELSEEYQPQIKAMQEEIDGETIEYINETTLLNDLRFDEMSVSGLLDIAKATGDNDLILQRQRELAEVKTKISIKELTVDHISATIEDLERQITQLQSQISVTSFSKKLYDELSMYIIESEFRDDRYINEEELYRDALKKFDEFKSPSVVIEASIDNIIDSLEEDYYSDKVVLGDIARVTDKEMNVEMKSLIAELSFDLDNNTCDVTIANGDIEKDGYDRILSVLYDTQSTTTSLENNKYKWDTVTDVKTEVDLMRDSEIDATRNRIKAGFRESVTIEDRGIILSNPDFPDEIVIMQAGVIALSTDGGENWSTSITPRGVMADTIIGKLVASNNLIVTNDSGSFRIDGDGLTVDMDSIKITSGEGDTPENIVDSWNKMLITMDEFADDGKLNEYEKNQIARQWNSIAIAHSSMVDAIQNAYGPETPENPYPAEYEIYMESYERLRRYLNDEIQSDGHTILDPLHRGETTDIDSDKYNRLVSDYEVNKDRFQTVIPLEFSQTFMEQTRNEISLNYVKNGEVATKLNLSEEGVRIDGRLLEVNAETHFNDDLVMNAGLIRSADNAINIDLNKGIINLSRPLTINAVPVATEDFVEENLSDAIKNIDVEYGITSDKSTPPSDWNTTSPAWEDGKYIWSRTITVYKNGRTEITDPVNITGATGSSGGTGQAGRSVKSIQEQYYLSTSPLDLENGSWRDNPPEWEADKYIWTRSVITYENPYGVERTEEISVSGQQGPKGEDGLDGEDAPLVKLSGETQIIKQDSRGRLTPSNDFIVTAHSVNTTIIFWQYSVDGGGFSGTLPVGVARSGSVITVNPSLVEFSTMTIRVGDGEVYDNFTIARAVDGATGEDAYTIILTNEAHTFAGNIFSAIPSSTTTDIVAYKGNVRVPVTVDSITGAPDGMTSGISSNGTINARVTFSVTDKLVEEAGIAKINLVLNGTPITKEFSFAVAYKGERGEQGPIGLTGLQGPEGDQGIQGPEGDDGLNSYTHIAYATGDQGQSFNHDTFPQATHIGMYVSHNQNSSDNWKHYNWTLIKGKDGSQGIQGPEGLGGITPYFHTAYANSVDGKVGFSVDDSSDKEYIGQYTSYARTGKGRNLLANTTSDETTSKTEREYKLASPLTVGWYMVSFYAKSNNPTTAMVYVNDNSGNNRIRQGLKPSVALTSTMQKVTVPIEIIASDGVSTGTITLRIRSEGFDITDSSTKLEKGSEATPYSIAPEDAMQDSTNPEDYSWTKIKGNKGDDGKGIKSQVVTYQNHTNGTTRPTGEWTENPNPVKGEYLWTRTVTQYTEGNPITTYNVSYSATDGQRGPEGVGIESTEIRYQQSASGNSTPSGTWHTSIPTPEEGRYLWTRTVIKYTDETSSTSYSTSYYAKKGDRGDDGISIKEVDIEYAQNASSTSAPTGGWNTNAPTWKNGQYIWSRTKTTYSIGNPTYSKPACITGQKGSEGEEGNDGRGISSIVEQYYLSNSKETRTGGSWTTTAPKWKQGKYMWTRNQINWTNPTGTTETTPIVDIAWEAVDEATKGVGLEDKAEISSTKIYTDKADDSAVHVEVDGKSVGGGSGGSGKNIYPHHESILFGWGNTPLDKSYFKEGVVYSYSYEIEVIDSKVSGSKADFDERLGRMVYGGVKGIDMRDWYINAYVGDRFTQKGTFSGQPRSTHFYVYGVRNNTTNTNRAMRVTKLMINEGRNLLPYEPPAPTPDRPIQIHSVNDFDVVSSQAINMFNSKDFIKQGIDNGLPKENITSIEVDGYSGFRHSTTAYVERYFDYLKGQFEENTGYTFSYEYKFTGNNENSQSGMKITYTTGDDDYTRFRGLSDSGKVIVKTDPNRTVRSIKIGGWAYSGSFELWKISLIKTSEFKGFVPHAKDITEEDDHPLIDKIKLSLSEPLRSVGNAKDRLYRDSDGLWKIERNIAYKSIGELGPINTFSGDNEYHFNGSVAFLINYPNSQRSVNTRDILSSHFKRTSSPNYNSEGAEVNTIFQLDPTRFAVRVPEGTIGVTYANTIYEKQNAFRNWSNSNNVRFQYILGEPAMETLDQDLQDKLNNLRSFQDSNYVYTIINNKTDLISESLKPTLHATFKGGGWYSRWKTEDELEKQQRDMENKADSAEVEAIGDRLGNYVLVEGYEDEIGEIDSALKDYKAMIESNEKDTGEAIKDVSTLITRTNALTENLGEFTRSWAFLDTKITMGKEGLLVGEYDFSDPDDPEEPVLTNGILVGTDRIDFISNKASVAHITGQLMQIDHGIFVETLRVGEHKIETMSGGHTIWQWVE